MLAQESGKMVRSAASEIQGAPLASRPVLGALNRSALAFTKLCNTPLSVIGLSRGAAAGRLGAHRTRGAQLCCR